MQLFAREGLGNRHELQQPTVVRRYSEFHDFRHSDSTPQLTGNSKRQAAICWARPGPQLADLAH